MGLQYEDKVDISGDPPPDRPMTNAQLKGSQARDVNRNRAGPQPVGKGMSPGAQPDSQPKDKPDQQPQPPADAQSQSTPGLTGAQQMQAGEQAQSEKALNYPPNDFNPFHPIDYLKAIAEKPVETYYLGQHIWHALNAIFDPNAISGGLMDMQAQSDAYIKLHPEQATQGNPKIQEANRQALAAAEHPVDPQARQQQDQMVGGILANTADPRYLPMWLVGGPGPKMVAAILGPTIGNAIFDKAPSAGDFAWSLIPAMLLGGKMPAPVEKAMVDAIPGISKLITKVTALKAAQEANQMGAQDREALIKRILDQGAQGAKAVPLAPAFGTAEKALTAEEETALKSDLVKKYGSEIMKGGEYVLSGKDVAMLQEKQLTADMLQRYGTLDPLKVMDNLMRDDAPATMLRNVWTKLFKMPYDFVLHSEAELPLVDPRHHITGLPAAVQAQVHEHWPWTVNMVHEATLGPAGNAASPAISRFRSLVGMKGTNHLTLAKWTQGLRDIAAKEGVDPQELDLLNRSLESSGNEAQTAYLSLSPQMKYVRDSMRFVASGLGMSAEELGTIEGRVNNYWPRVGLLIKEKGGLRAMGSRKGPLTAADRKSRTLGAVETSVSETEARIGAQQLYATVKEANAAVDRQIARVVDDVLRGTPAQEIERHLAGQGVIPAVDRTMLEGIHARSLNGDYAGAKKEAEQYASDLIPHFSENPFDGISKLGRQMDAIASKRAVNDLLSTVGHDGREIATLRPANARAYAALVKQGYRAIDVPGFQHVMVNKEYGDLLEKAQVAVQKGGLNLLQTLADIEGKSVAMIMYSPRIHGMNMALRLGMGFLMHPVEVSNWFAAGMMQKGGLSQFGLQGVTRIGPEPFRMIPRNYGLVPPSTHLGAAGMWADSANSGLGKLFGDIDMQRVPLVKDMQNSPELAKASDGAKAVLGSVKDLLWGKQSDLWSWVSDFGNMMWWVEYSAARRGGMIAPGLEHEAAARYATLRANSWMGHVSPVDSNPNFQALAKTVTFAPNWWRTWGELLTGYYRKAGVGWSKDTIAYVVENEIKTAAAALAFQQMSANVLNGVLSGHTIYQNDPGNWGKVEVTQPWAIEALDAMSKMLDPSHKGLGIDPKTGRDAQGRKLALENPFARQATDTEGLMGMLTSSSQMSPETMFQGALGFGAARTSPVMSALAALGNIDLYRSISSGGTRYVDPNHDTFAGNPLSDILTAAGDLTPFSYISQNIQSQVIQGNVQNVKGPFGIPIPQAVLNSFSGPQLAGDAARSMLVGMTGVNPPYMRSSKTQGVSPTDDQYKNVRDATLKYQTQMTALSTSTLTGQMSPYQWIAAYRQLSIQHSAAMKMAFTNAPEYNNGPLGLTNAWEGLYDKATGTDGVLNSDQLRGLQAQWRSSHSAADYTAVQNELRVNDAKYPMMALYHKTLDAYDNWQADWAKQNGVDVATLQSDLYGYSQVYSDRYASTQWLSAHPDIAQFEAAKKADFESSNSQYGEAGLMYALFFNPTAADRYLGVASGTDAERAQAAQPVEQAVQKQQVPAAP